MKGLEWMWNHKWWQTNICLPQSTHSVKCLHCPPEPLSGISRVCAHHLLPCVHVSVMLARINNTCPAITSFIHFEHFYSAPSRRLLRSAPNSSTAKKESFFTSPTALSPAGRSLSFGFQQSCISQGSYARLTSFSYIILSLRSAFAGRGGN